MKCAIVSIGDELLSGKTVESNSAWLAKELNSLGIQTIAAFTVPDVHSRMVGTIEQALSMADLVITTGGLGPTDDDRTREALAEVAGVELRLDEELFRAIRRIFADRGIAMPKNVEREAYIPDSARILPNGIGVAPGLFLELDNRYLVALPGVPTELRDIFTNQLRPILHRLCGTDAKRVEVFFTTGMPESALFTVVTDKLGGLGTDALGSYPSNLGVELRLTIDKKDSEAARRIRIIENSVAPWCYSRIEKSLPAVIGKLLIDNGKTLGVAESCTGGLLASRIVEISGASNWFAGGVVTYSNDAKIDVLGVCTDDITAHGAVSAQVAAQMADGAARVLGTTFALSTTGIAGPSGGTPEKPVGSVYYALHTPARTLVRQNRFTRGREDHRYRTSQAALTMLWLELVGRYDNHPWKDGSVSISHE